MKKKTWRYEVRTKGDCEFDYFIHFAVSEQDINYDDRNIRSSRRYANKIGGWVVKITEEIL